MTMVGHMAAILARFPNHHVPPVTAQAAIPRIYHAGCQGGGDGGINRIATTFIVENAGPSAVARNFSSGRLNGGVWTGHRSGADVGRASCGVDASKRRYHGSK